MTTLKTAILALTFSTGSIVLSGCAHTSEPPPPVPPLVITLKDKPAADLLECSVRPKGFSPQAVAIIPADVASTLVEIGVAFGATADRLDRLVNWLEPGSCP